MLLKSLEIKGFKSFADKTVLNFDQGITGIIGPNGCGKSNIIDSIRWVIGEQKITALRSENLDSLVFNGSKTRNASSFAEVSLIFENTKNLLPTEYSEVCITRRFYKNGESEYRLNDVICRLKDIHILLLDTGVSNDSYSIIELGMVDDIIRDKENSRRRMLEQAAGITSYKNRKKEAKSKLDSTELDISRIQDILFEINNQLKTLESQAKKAEKYYELKNEYKLVSIDLAKGHIEGYNDLFKNLTNKQIEDTNLKLKFEASIATEVANLEQSKLRLLEQEKELQTQQVNFNHLLKKLNDEENEKKIKIQQIGFLEEKIQSIQKFIQKSSEQVQLLEQAIQHAATTRNNEDSQLINLQTQLSQQTVLLEAKRKEYDLNRKNLDTQRIENQKNQFQKFELEKKIALLNSNIENAQKQILKLDEELNNYTNQFKNLSQQVLEVEKNLLTETKAKDSLVEINIQIEEKIKDNKEKIEQFKTNKVEENRVLDAKKNEYALLKNLIESLEGYPESVKYLHKNKDWQTNAILVSDVLFVQEQYRTAIENILEPYLNYFIVQNQHEAIQALHLLDNNKKGKANFFILDEFNLIQIKESENIENAVSAIDLIEIDNKYQKLFQHLLSNVYITENENIFLDKSDKIFIEKTGKWIKGKYSISGGSVGIFEGKKIGRKKNLEKLVPIIENQEQKIRDLELQLKTKISELESLNVEKKDGLIKQKEQLINQLQNQLNSVKNKIEFIEQTIQNIQKNKNDLTIKLDNENTLLKENNFSFKDILNAYNQQLADLQKNEKLYFEVEQAYHQLSNQFNEINLNISKQQNRIQSLKQELVFKENQINELNGQKNTSTIELEKIKLDLEESNKLLKELENRIYECIVLKDTEEKKLNLINQEFHNFKNDLRIKEDELKINIKLKETNEAGLNEIKDKLNEIKFQLAGLKERLMVEFKIELDSLFDQPKQLDLTNEELQETANKIKKRLDNIGEINPIAIEAFAEMKLRYDFILEQKTDLVNAKESLLQTIQEVEATANQQFLDTFNKVKEHFQRVFKTLFTEEDTADLILTNPENLAETAIEVIAKPKGKRPSSISQLSGGEKTLTATALLFSIYLIKPAPFCIFDEVDAPLDDTNVEKFTQLIRTFSANSQFIIVTHNKQTMRSVDIIYGVTMQEAGVSKIVPVDFRQLD